MGMIILETENVYNVKVIENIKQITDSLRTFEGISTITSLTNIINIKSDTAGIEIGKLIDEYNLPTTQAEIDQIKQKVNEKDMYKGSIMSEDGKATIVLFTLQGDVNQQDLATVIRKKIDPLPIKAKVLFGGFPMMLKDISDLIIKDMLWLIPTVSIVLLIVLLVSFKSLKATILPLLTVGIASVWTLGLGDAQIRYNHDWRRYSGGFGSRWKCLRHSRGQLCAAIDR